VTAIRNGLVAGSDNYLNLLIQVQGPDVADASAHGQRSALNLALVIDRSGSMSGRHAAHLGPNSIARVLLLSDGCANQGMTSIERPGKE
jgi:secreted protein with Ig-like and vWFA domain